VRNLVKSRFFLALEATALPRWKLLSRPHLPLPEAVFVSLPIGDLDAVCLGLTPTHVSYFNSFGIIAVEQQHHTLIIVRIRYQIRGVDEKADCRAVRIFHTGGKHDRLFSRFRIA